MSDLLWPGDHRAGDLFTDAAVVAAMVRVEAAWSGLDLAGVIQPSDVDGLAVAGEDGGNPVIPLLALLRARLGPAAAARLHTGLTSQDVLDTALALCLRAAAAAVLSHLDAIAATLGRLAGEHRDTPMAGRTLTQYARPITFGHKVAGWRAGVLDARGQLAAVAVPPVQLGGPVGTLDAGERGAAVADTLGLAPAAPWPTARGPFVRAGDALVACTDAFGRIANDVLAGARTEVGELGEPVVAGRGGSSAMPHKRNPVLAVLVRRAALAGPPLAATLHTAAASVVDERSDGAWHLEWAAIRALARRTVAAASETAELVGGLRVDAGRMAANLRAAQGAS